MINQYLNWYNMVQETLESEVFNSKEYKDIERVVVIGMGGSGIVGDILSVIAQNYSNLLMLTYKDFYVPNNFISNKTFVLAISYSGNTLETIASVIQLLKKGLPIGVVASGGELLDIAKKHILPHIVVRPGLAPRSAMPLMLVASIKLLSSCGIRLVSWESLHKSLAILRNTEEANRISDEVVEFLKESAIPLIVATNRYHPLAIRIKNELNENAKMPAKIEVIPELFHNDIVGWERHSGREKAIIISSDIEYEEQLLKFYGEYLESTGFDVYHLKLSGNIIERYLFGSLIAGIASAKIANKLGLDPLQTRSIVMYKEFLKKHRDDILKKVLSL